MKFVEKNVLAICLAEVVHRKDFKFKSTYRIVAHSRDITLNATTLQK